ncbi:hypothetical protein, partial [Diplocloster modestus]
PISFRFNRVTALSEEEAPRHRSPWRAPIGYVQTERTPGGLRPDFRTVSPVRPVLCAHPSPLW